MNKFKGLALATSLAFVAGCSGDRAEKPAPAASTPPPPAATAAGDAADYVFTNAYVYTVDENNPEAEAVAVTDNKIVYVGDSAGAKALVGDGTELIDVQGKMILPGFVSGHDHLAAANWTKAGVDLFSGRSKEDYLKLIKDYADANPDEKFIYGYGYNYQAYGGRPTAADLDTVVPDRPAFIFDFTIHDAWLNSKAMEMGGIDKNTEDLIPNFTFWERDEEGNPTGAAIELAWMPPYIDSGAWQRDVLIPRSQEVLYNRAASQGWTTVMIPGLVTPNLKDLEGNQEDMVYTLGLLHDLEQAGELKLRTMFHYMYKNGDINPEDVINYAVAMREKYDSDVLRLAGIKIHPEANWVTYTSVMLEEYADKPGEFGTGGIAPERVAEMILKANNAGLDVSTHVDGSATVRSTIDSIEASLKSGNGDARNTLQHLINTDPADMKRIGDLNIGVNLTPIWAPDWSDTIPQAIEKLGTHRVETQYQQVKGAIDQGVTVSISADVPSTPSELAGALMQMESAITRKDPTNPDSVLAPPASQAISVAEAIRAVTIGPAWQVRMEDKVGSIAVGKYADLVILENNLFKIDTSDIADTEVLGTMMNGKFTHRDGI